MAGKFEWGAKENIKLIGTGRTDDAIALSEHPGEAKQEAESKATAEAKEWIASRCHD